MQLLFIYVKVLLCNSITRVNFIVAISTMAGDCEDGQVRLSGGRIDNQNLTMDGRLEICFNNAWGTVCNNLFRINDAQVACNQLIGFDREGLLLLL